MKKFIVFILGLCLLESIITKPISVAALENNNVYISYAPLTQQEKSLIFEKGYQKIIEYNDSKTRSSGTHTDTTCTSMQKRGYDWIGYSKQCFQETYSAVSLSSGTFDFSVSIVGIGISIPVANMKQSANGSYALTASDLEKVNKKGYYSCLRMKAYLTKASYTAKIYDNASGALLSTSNYTHTYRYKRNKKSGIDYYLYARTTTQCNEIKKNKYVGTKSEKSAMNKTAWKKVSTKDSVLP